MPFILGGGLERGRNWALSKREMQPGVKGLGLSRQPSKPRCQFVQHAIPLLQHPNWAVLRSPAKSLTVKWKPPRNTKRI